MGIGLCPESFLRAFLWCTALKNHTDKLHVCNNSLINTSDNKKHNFYINYVFSFLTNKNIEVNFNYSNFYFLIFTPNSNSNENVSTEKNVYKIMLLFKLLYKFI